MKKLFYSILLFTLFSIQIPVQAALVNIPDANFRAKLKARYGSCFIGDQLQTSCNSIKVETYLDVTGLNISNLSGIEYFTNLRQLFCSNNQLTNLPALSALLTQLNCSNNQLISLPVLPGSLKDLDCSYNRLTILPALPAGLGNLNCRNNQLTSLPVLPGTLKDLNCAGNQIASLPVLPGTLVNLYCVSNQIISLPDLPNSLRTLNASDNLLTSLPPLKIGLSTLSFTGNQLQNLPVLPGTLKNLIVGKNPLTTLPNLPEGLIVLSCSNCQLGTLPPLPNTLLAMYCDNNKLDSLPTLPQKLTYLYCYRNQLLSLPTLPTGLKELECNYNELTSLPVFPAALTSVYCQFNKLSTLPSLPASLKTLFCYNNKLTSLPALPGSLTDLRCHDNRLDFEDIEAISPKPNYSFFFQRHLILPATQTLHLGDSLLIDGSVGGSANYYEWYKDGVLISAGTNQGIYIQAGVTGADAGVYRCRVTSLAANSLVNDVFIDSNYIKVIVLNDQSISFGALDNKRLGDEPFVLSAAASSGLAVRFTSTDTTVATISGDTVIIIGVGTTNIVASQPGNENYNAAPNVTQSLIVDYPTSTFNVSANTLTNNSYSTSASLTQGRLTALADHQVEEERVLVSPNPTNGNFELKFDQYNIPADINILTSSGKMIFQKKFTNVTERLKINISHFEPGMYLIYCNYGSGVIIKKIVLK